MYASEMELQDVMKYPMLPAFQNFDGILFDIDLQYLWMCCAVALVHVSW